MGELRVWMITPEYLPSTRGNATTVHRIATSLSERGVHVEVRTPHQLEPPPPRPEPVPDVLHAFHARICATPARGLAAAWGSALVVTITGTDANVDLGHPDRAPGVLANLRAAAIVVVFHASMGEVITAAAPELGEKIRIIPQAPYLPQRTWDFRAHAGIPRRAVVLFLPGGIRPVKNTLMPFAPFRRLRDRHPNLHLVLAGPRLDEDYAQLVDAELARTPGATYAGELPHDAMYGAMAASDVVLNCSHSEGGMANTVLEAMTTGTPVLASRIPGNLSLVREGVTGHTFASDQDFEQAVEAFVASPREARRLAQTARDEVTRTYRREAEAQSYELVYREAMASPPSRGR